MKNSEREELLKEIIDISPIKPNGRYIIAPRFGKSRLVIELIKINKPKSILWITPLADLAKKEIPEEFVKWKAKRYLSKLDTVTWTSLNKIKKHYEMVIYDEEQYATENNLSSVFNKELTYDYAISMTGTESKHSEKQDLYKKLGLDIIYEMSINDAVDIGILANYTINLVEVPLSTKKDIEVKTKDKQFFTSEENQYKFIDKTFKAALYQKRSDLNFRMLQRMRAIYDSKSKEEAASILMKSLQGRKLLFCSSTKQAEKLCENTYHSKTDGVKFRQFVNGEINEIAMVNKGGTGATYKEIDHFILIQADSDKNGLTTQKICRTLLQQSNYQAIIWIICLIGTQDEKWVASALERFDPSKISYFNLKNMTKDGLSKEEVVKLNIFKDT